jgi:pimeloyl-ACP methyl ester carboxylesterase
MDLDPASLPPAPSGAQRPSPHLTSPHLSARTLGAGDLVVCLHSSAGTHAQWLGLANTLSRRWKVLAPDLHGHGHSPQWPHGASSTLHVDAHAVSALIDGAQAARGVHLVGHSYGAAVALQIALQRPQQVRSLSLYEPVAFGLLRELAPRDPALLEITDVAHTVLSLLSRGALDDAAASFIGYWGGEPTWNQMAAAQRDAVAGRMPTVPRHFDALFAARWHKRLLERLTMPILLMHGSQTRTPARRVTELLSHVLPHAVRAEVPGAGHLGPMTHAGMVNTWVVGRIDPTLVGGLDRVPLAA